MLMSGKKYYFLELESGETGIVGNLKKWFVDDGYIFDMMFSGLVIILNTVLALQTYKPIDR